MARNLEYVDQNVFHLSCIGLALCVECEQLRSRMGHETVQQVSILYVANLDHNYLQICFGTEAAL